MASTSDESACGCSRARTGGGSTARPLLREIAAATGTEPSLDDFLALAATERLRWSLEDQAQYHQVHHRIWGDRLAGEVARTLAELADRLDDAEAYLLWRDPPEAVLVPVGAMLRHTAAHLSPGSDLTLISGDTKSGLVVTWDHLSHADQYSLLTWGSFAFDLTQSRADCPHRLLSGRHRRLRGPSSQGMCPRGPPDATAAQQQPGADSASRRRPVAGNSPFPAADSAATVIERRSMGLDLSGSARFSVPNTPTTAAASPRTATTIG